MFETMPADLGAGAVSAAHAAIAQLAAQAAAAGNAPGAPTSVTGNLALARARAAAYGWDSGAEWNALYATGNRESGWNNTAQNPTSTAYGIAQFLDSTWASVGMRKTSDAGAQIDGMLRYIGQRYVDPIGAWRHEQQFGWYDQGGLVPKGVSTVVNGTGGTEHLGILTNPQWDTLRAVASPEQAPAAIRSREMGGVGGHGGRSTGPANVTVQARVFIGNREITDIARVEATAAVDQAMGQLADDVHYAGG
jgi:hypothetical protein